MTARQRSWRVLLIPAMIVSVTLCVAGQAHAQAQIGAVHVMKPRGASTATTGSAGNLIDHGGPVLPTSTTYAIWWGDPSAFPADAQEGVDQFLSGLNGSAYLDIANQYMRGGTAETHFGGNFFYNATSTPTDPPGGHQFAGEVCGILKKLGVAPDPSGIYFVFTPNFPANANFCAFHNWVTCTTTTPTIEIAYMPNATGVQQCDGTRFDALFEPNDYSQGTQALINITAHEFMESITDPLFSAWYDSTGLDGEMGDKCAWIFQSAVPLANGSPWKMQEEYSNQASGCDQGAGFNGQVLGAFSNSGKISTFTAPGATYGTFAHGINQGGEIAGWYYSTKSEVSTGVNEHLGERAFVRDPGGTITAFDGPGAYVTEANSINGAGAITGAYFDASFVEHGLVRDPNGVITTFDASGANGTSTVGRCINDSGAIVGSYVNGSIVEHGYVRNPNGVITTFDAPGSAGTTTTGTLPLSINGVGAIAGYYSDANGVNHAFVRDPYGNITAFDATGAGTAAGQGTIARGINGLGAIAGSYSDANNLNHGFVRDPHGIITTFDTPGAVYGTFVYSINAKGTVAGDYSDSSGLSHAFLRDGSGNFSTPNAPGSTYGSVARSINDLGAISGYVTEPTK